MILNHDEIENVLGNVLIIQLNQSNWIIKLSSLDHWYDVKWRFNAPSIEDLTEWIYNTNYESNN